MRRVEIIYASQNPIEITSKAAGTSYGKTDASFKRLKNCFENSHMSVFEHVGATFYISDISRACSHQLVRHRMASFVQKSQRYTKINADNNDWFVVPPEIEENPDAMEEFQYAMSLAISQYRTMLRILNIKPEDARYLLPEATKTEITMTMNLRELFHFFDLRCDKAAQWEIRNLANEIKEELYNYNDEWRQIIDLYEGEM